MNIKRNINTIFLALILANLFCSCKVDSKPYHENEVLDELVKADLLSQLDALIQVHVPEYLLVDEDTFKVVDSLLVFEATNSGDLRPIIIGSDYWLVVKEYDSRLCKLTMLK